jgi:hypothetical protein
MLVSVRIRCMPSSTSAASRKGMTHDENQATYAGGGDIRHRPRWNDRNLRRQV